MSNNSSKTSLDHDSKSSEVSS